MQGLFGAAGLAAAGQESAESQERRPSGAVPSYARAQNHKSLKQSSFDTTGGNHDYWAVAKGETKEVFNAAGPGVITHIWFTIAARGANHLKEIVLRGYWDGNAKPSIEAPIGDFFGLNLGQYAIYQSAYLACSPGKSLNCYFAMPYKQVGAVHGDQ